jgi:hypothetical protein
LEGEDLLWRFFEDLPQLSHFYPPNIPYFVGLWDWFGIFDLAQKNKPHPWEPALELLLTAERHKGKAIVVFGRIRLGADVWGKPGNPQASFLQDFPLHCLVDILIGQDPARRNF